MIKVSVIIPVYNAQDYLVECIQSLTAQTLTDCEFIFINDGSTDKSLDIIDNFKKYDTRIVLLSQKNQGVSAARNKGISLAKGEYIGFVDADDYVDANYFEKLYYNAKTYQSDIVITKSIDEMRVVNYKSDTSFEINKIFDNQFCRQEILPHMIQKDNMNSSCNKIYKTDFIKLNQIKFPINVALGEDGLFNFKSFFYATNVVFIDVSGYFYREVKGSASRNVIAKDYFKRALEVYDFDYYNYINANLVINNLDKLKSLRLLEKVVSYISIYLNATNEIPFFYRYSYVKKMINHKIVQENINLYWDEVILKKSRYEKFILQCIKYNTMIPLLFATKYSYLRNKN